MDFKLESNIMMMIHSFFQRSLFVGLINIITAHRSSLSDFLWSKDDVSQMFSPQPVVAGLTSLIFTPHDGARSFPPLGLSRVPRLSYCILRTLGLLVDPSTPY
jgi:hypothetical protein